MGLRQQKHAGFKAGFPEFLAMLLLMATVALGLIWFQDILNGHWIEDMALVTRCTLSRLAYTTTPQPDQVDLSYSYQVNGVEYTGTWHGFWPKENSPNAMPPQELPNLRKTPFFLKIKYDQDNPALSLLHYRPGAPRAVIQILFFTLLLLLVFYGTHIYPNLKIR